MVQLLLTYQFSSCQIKEDSIYGAVYKGSIKGMQVGALGAKVQEDVLSLPL